MSSLKLFLKENKKAKENAKYAVTKSLCDEKGNPLEWEIRPISTALNEEIREECTVEVPVTGKPNIFRQKLLSSKYIAKLLCASVVFPDLMNAELQDSYGVSTPEKLLYAMVDDPGEYNDFAQFVQNLNGFDETIEDKIDEAKN